MKRIFLIISIFILIGTITYVFWMFFSNTSSPSTETTYEFLKEVSAIRKEKNLPKLQEETDVGSLFGYAINNGKLYYVDLLGNLKSSVSQNVIKENLSEIHSFSPNGKYILLSSGYPFETKYQLFDVAKNEFASLPAGIFSVTWDPASQKIAYLRKINDTSEIGTFSLSNKRGTRIIGLNVADGEISWPTKNEIYIADRPSVASPSSLWRLNLTTLSLTNIAKNETGLLVGWDLDGKNALKFSVSGPKIFFTLVDKNNKLIWDFSTSGFITFPGKCAFGVNKIYCAVPKSINKSWILPDDYLKGKFFSEDTLYEIDLSTLSSGLPIIKPIYFGLEKIDAIELKMTENKLHFINRYDQKLYSVETP